MSINSRNDKCNGCRYSGIYLCTNSRECNDNSLYEIKPKH